MTRGEAERAWVAALVAERVTDPNEGDLAHAAREVARVLPALRSLPPEARAALVPETYRDGWEAGRDAVVGIARREMPTSGADGGDGEVLILRRLIDEARALPAPGAPS